jgi:hypothetical protein
MIWPAIDYKINKPSGLDGLRGVWLALLILWMVITQPLTPKVKDSNLHCTTIDTKNQRFKPTTMHYTTIDPKIQRFEPTTMSHYTTILHI